MKKILFFILLSFNILYLLDVIKYADAKQYLLKEGNYIVELIIHNGNINSELIEYVSYKDYLFNFDNSKEYKSGELFHFELVYPIDLIFQKNKILSFEQDVIIESRI